MSWPHPYMKPRNLMVTRIDVAEEDVPLLAQEDQMSVTPEDTKNPVIPQNENAQQDLIDEQRPASKIVVDVIDPDKIPLLDSGDDSELTMEEPHTPSSILDYYNEAALKAKDRNALSDDQFGIPRLRSYPLNDKAHTQQAIRMFGHCKDPKDRKQLASRIFSAMEKFKIDTKIGKKNALYEYAPEALRESAELPKLVIAGFETPMTKRTKKDIIEEHMRVNRGYYNNIFYGPEFIKSVKALKEFPFFDYFYPDLQRMSFVTRLESVCGGMASGDQAQVIFHNLGIRQPLETDFTKELGWINVSTEEDREDVSEVLHYTNYSAESNWFKTDLGNDVDHSLFCMRLYSIMGEILLDPGFDPEVSLTDKHHGILMDWGQRVQYHYDLYLDAKPESDAQIKEMQYLWDLFWCFNDNPVDENIITVNIISMLNAMACVRDRVIDSMNEANDAGEMISKERCSAYLVHDLGMPDSLFLLPGTMEYPIIDKASIRLAMDMISRIPEDNRDEYIKNLNRKYKEFGCNFSISIDHPYAKYADENIIEHMSHILLEGETAVDDEGTSVTRSERVTQPWYKRFDHNRGLDINVLDNHELGPNTKKIADPEFTTHTSVL